MEVFLKDLRLSIRSFLRTPVVAITAIATIAIGIGANTAVFSVVDAVLLRPARYVDPDQVVYLATTTPQGPSYTASDPKFNYWREQTEMLRDVTGIAYGTTNLTGVDPPEQIQIARVTADYFRLLGLSFALGRGFARDEDRAGAPSVAVLSGAFWKRTFGGDPAVIGKTIVLGGVPHEVIGVVAADVSTEAKIPPDVWIPLSIDPTSTNQAEYFFTLGRLQPGVTLGMARARLQLAGDEYRRMFLNSVTMRKDFSFGVAPVREVLVHDVRPALLILLGAVSLVLLIACANVANLLLVRANGRQREIAIRCAVGAGRGRIVRQLLGESVLLGLIGGMLGLVVGVSGIRLLLALNPAIPRIGVNGANVSADERVLAFTLLLSLLTGVLFGLIPALQAARSDLSRVLTGNNMGAGMSRERGKVQSLLVVSEIALALILSVGAALLIRSFLALRAVEPGFDIHNLLTLHISLSSPRFKSAAQVDQFIRQETERLGSLPGVVSVGVASWLPFEFGASLPFTSARVAENGPIHPWGNWRNVSPGYFDALKIPLVRGRLLTDGDKLSSPGVVIINRAMAKQYWQDRDPLHERITIAPHIGREFDEAPREIIGVVGDIHDEGLDHDARPTMYVPNSQVNDARMERLRQSVVWMIRTKAEPHSLAQAIRNELREASGLPVGNVRSMDEVVDETTARRHFDTLLLSVFGGSALFLAAIGVYGVIAYSVQQRTREIGIRLALGAGSTAVRNMVVRDGLRLAIWGLTIGIAAAFGLTRFLAGFLFGTKTSDPIAFAVAPIVLIAIALIAVWLPAERAGRIDPVTALRSE